MSLRTTNPREDNFRDLIRDAGASAPELHLDPATVVGEGSRVVRRKRILTGVSSLAAATVLAIGGYAVLAGGSNLAGDLTPADRIVEVAPPITDVGVVSVTLEPGDIDGEGMATGPATSFVEVTVDTGAAENQLEVSIAQATAEGAAQGAARTETLDTRTGITRIDDSDFGYVIVVQPESEWSTITTNVQTEGGWTSDVKALGESGYEARAFRMASPAALGSVTGILRAIGTDVIVDDQGQQIAAGRSEDGRQFYYSERLDTFGLTGGQGGGGSMWPSSGAVGERPMLHVGNGIGDNSTMEFTLAMLVEAGASDPSADIMADGIGAVPVEVVSLDARHDVLVATYEAGSGTMAASEVFRWTDTSGLDHAYSTDATGTQERGRVRASADVLSDGSATVFVHQQADDSTETPLLPVGTIELAADEPGAWIKSEAGEFYGVVRGEPQDVSYQVTDGGQAAADEDRRAIVVGDDLWLVTALKPEGQASLAFTGVEWVDPSGAVHTATF